MDINGKVDGCCTFQESSSPDIPIAMKLCTNNLNAIRHLEHAVPAITDKYKIAWSVGRGHYGSVLLGAKKNTKTPLYAIKLIEIKGNRQEVQNEINHLRKLRGAKGIVEYVDHFYNGDHVAIVTKYFQRDSFNAEMRQFSPADVQRYMRCLLKALATIHSYNISHGDVKPDNFLFNLSKNKYALVDLGMAMPFGYPCKDRGTKGYIAPECIVRYDHSTGALDVFSAGVIFLILLSGLRPFFVMRGPMALREFSMIFGTEKVMDTAVCLNANNFSRLAVQGQGKKYPPLDIKKICRLFRNYNRVVVTKTDQQVCEGCRQLKVICLCATETPGFNMLIDDVFPDCTYDLANRMVEMNPFKRITAEEALKHEFFQKKLDASQPFYRPSKVKFNEGVVKALAI